MRSLRTDLLLLAVALCVFSPRASLQARLEPPALAAPALVTWAELARHPSQHLGQRVRIELQFHSRVVNWNAYMTRFGPAAFQAWQFWTDEQFPWVKDDYDSPAA